MRKRIAGPEHEIAAELPQTGLQTPRGCARATMGGTADVSGSGRITTGMIGRPV